VELIVVLTIFSAMSSIVIFNYGEFQAKVDIKNVANDIALKIVEAQKNSISGQLNSHNTISNWKPSYGVYFNTYTNGLGDPKNFSYFTDANNSKDYDDGICDPANLSGECLEKINITKGNSISNLSVFYMNGGSATVNDLTIIFTRPNNIPLFRSTTPTGPSISYFQITVISPKTATAKIKVYSSGRIQIN